MEGRDWGAVTSMVEGEGTKEGGTLSCDVWHDIVPELPMCSQSLKGNDGVADLRAGTGGSSF